METVENLTQKEQELQNQLNQLANEKKAAQESERQASINLVKSLEQDAVRYRVEAEKAATDEEKRNLYKYAAANEQHANELREQLGLEVVAVPEPYLEVEHNKVLRKINGFFIRAIIALAAYMFTDLVAGKMDSGFFSYGLETISKIAYVIFSVYGGIWLVCRVLLTFVSSYVFNQLGDDWKKLKPFHKLLLLVVIAAGLLHFIKIISPNAV